MNKYQWISIALRILGIVAALWLGIWYLSSAVEGDELTYTSVNSFLHAIGADNGIENTGTLFLGKYVVDLLNMLGTASDLFWAGIVNNLWILMVAGFGVYMFISAIKYVWSKAKKNAEYSDKANDMDFKTWFDPVWKLGLRVAVAGTAIGALSLGGTEALTVVSSIIINPILYAGSLLSMAATNISSATECTTFMGGLELTGAMSAVSGSFMCVLGNLYSIMLAGAAGGFSLMNYSALGLGGGFITWVSGLGLVLAFLVVGFDLFFQIFSILFKVVFVIIFLPLLIAAFAYETVWKVAAGLFRKALTMVVQAAVSVISISLKIVLLFSIIYYAADAMFPAPVDTYTAIFPPFFDTVVVQNTSPETESVMSAFATCEQTSLDANGVVNKDVFKPCFLEQKQIIETEHPGAFDFLKHTWTFLITMVGLLLLYYFVVNPRVDKLLPAGKIKLPIPGENADVGTDDKSNVNFDIGKWTHDLGQKVWHAPKRIFDSTVKGLKDNGIIR